MNQSVAALQHVNSFFDSFADALEKFDTKTMAYLYNMPCTLLSDDTTTVFNDPTKLEGFFNQGAYAYRQFGVVNIRHEVWSKHKWTEKMVLVKVRWYYSGILNDLIYSCDYQYVMKLDKQNQLKIVMSISLNEREKMEEWKKNTQHAR